ncbi:helix-turn-helix domain-containing protein [Limibacter armeniacum]|uniref:helix-turn-helix domain-containing protein n=1 Tax=Limibacter armeniacum TaxID=466084 RepID=UPI0038CC06E3
MLTSVDRLYIALSLKLGQTQAEIARELDVHRSTICREIKRNSFQGKYLPHLADQLYKARKVLAGSLPKNVPSVSLKLQRRKRKSRQLLTPRYYIAWRSDWYDHYLRGTRRQYFPYKSRKRSPFKLHQRPIQYWHTLPLLQLLQQTRQLFPIRLPLQPFRIQLQQNIITYSACVHQNITSQHPYFHFL